MKLLDYIFILYVSITALSNLHDFAKSNVNCET